MNSPQAFGPYELTERINIGGMAEVFRAIDRAHGRLVAVKRILPSIAEDDEFIEMFRDEAAIASQLDHPNIAKIYDVGKVDLSYYLALEFVNGKDLRVLFDRAARTHEPLPLELVLYTIMETAKGLDYAHHRTDARGKPLGVVHRDVSPQNILVSFDGDVKIVDFGIAKAAGKLARTQVGTIKGKFGYMSPEQVRGLPIDQRSDVFSLGICLWELLTLERLFAGDNEIVIMEKIRASEIPSLTSKAPDTPPELERIVLKALAKDVDERYARATELLEDLSSFARANGLNADRERAAEYMRRLFAGDAAIDAPLEGKVQMAEQKSGSDLDVFEGLSRKPARADDAPTPFAPPVARNSRPPPLPPAKHRTLLGMPGAPLHPSPVPPPPGTLPGSSGRSSGPPPLPGRSSMPPPPPSMRRPPLPSGPPTGTGRPAPGSSAAAHGHPPFAAVLPSVNPADVDMDWDEDEKTTFFEKNEPTTVMDRSSSDGVEAGGLKPIPPGGLVPPSGLRTRPGTGPSAPPAPPSPRRTSGFPPPPAGPMGPLPSVARPGPPMAAPPPRALASTRITGREMDRPSITSVMASPARARRKGSRFWVLATAALLGAGGAFYLMRGGKVAVFVSGVAGKPLAGVTVSVDGVDKCTASPCNLELDKGVHAIRASAEGHAPQEQGATIRAGEELAVNFSLAKASEGTGIKVSGKQDGVELFVDGRQVGPLPQEVKDLKPGTHKIELKGSDRYAADERTVNVDPDEMKDLGAISLKVLRGLATFEVRTPGVKITLVSGKDRRQLTDFSQPVEIETSKNWVIEASRPGYDDLREPIVFDDRAEKTFVIALQERMRPVVEGPAPAAAAVAPRAAEPRAAPEPKPAPEPRAAAPAPAAESESAAGGNCTLNFNSIPVSTVMVDGRPVGGTPKIGFSTPAGTHTVVFVNAEEGKKVTTVTCKPGETKTVAVRLSQ